MGDTLRLAVVLAVLLVEGVWLALAVALGVALPWHAREALAPLPPPVPVPTAHGVQATVPGALAQVSGGQGRQVRALLTLLNWPGGQRGRGRAGVPRSAPVGQAAPAGQDRHTKPQDRLP